MTLCRCASWHSLRKLSRRSPTKLSKFSCPATPLSMGESLIYTREFSRCAPVLGQGGKNAAPFKMVHCKSLVAWQMHRISSPSYIQEWKSLNVCPVTPEFTGNMVVPLIPSKNEWDLTNGPLSKLPELLDTQDSGSVQCQWVLLEISWDGTLDNQAYIIYTLWWIESTSLNPTATNLQLHAGLPHARPRHRSRCFVTSLSKIIYPKHLIYLDDLCFAWEKLCFGGVDLQK